MKFSLGIELGSDAMRNKANLAHALHGVANRIVNFNDGLAGEMSGQIPDEFGRTVGRWEIVEAATDISKEQIALKKRTPEYIIKIAAGDVSKLRRTDVFRVLESCSDHELAGVAAYTVVNRPDLIGEVADYLFA
jgi:hypothetical protein